MIPPEPPRVTLNRQDEIAVLTIDRPPVNALSHALRQLIAQRLSEVAADDTVRGLVVACAGRGFVSGAEISELGTAVHPMLRDLIEMLETLGKPSAAAVHGNALGGGLELALGCSYRVAAPSARFGLPEVRLGLLPGAGGTVRTTRLVGPVATQRLAGSGAVIDAPTALSLGLIDHIDPHAPADSAPVAAAIERLRAGIAAGDSPPPIAARAAPDVQATANDIDALADEQCRKARSGAPMLAAAAVKAAMTLPFDDAMRVERRLFDDALASPRFAALRHVFFAERAAAKPPADLDGSTARQVRQVGVIGAGTMGGGIAMAFANAGFRVTLHEVGQEPLDTGIARIGANYDRSVARGSLTRAEADQRRARIHGTTALADLSDCDLIVEAAFEDMAVKTAIFAELDGIARKGAVLATNTSYLDVNAIADATGRPGDVLGLHFFSPANVMRLVEIVRGAATTPDALATALGVVKALRKQPVIVGVCHGFVGNRMLAARNAQLSRLILEGAAPAQIDAAFRAFGWPMGPCEMQDLAGLDISWRNRRALGRTDALPDRLCELGRLGQKAGKGWYRYRDARTAEPDPEVDAVIAGIAADQGITRRHLTDAEIIERTHAPMIAEGRQILAEGVARQSSDIDVIWVHGYGFPRDLGGPMFWDDQGRAYPA